MRNMHYVTKIATEVLSTQSRKNKTPQNVDIPIIEEIKMNYTRSGEQFP